MLSLLRGSRGTALFWAICALEALIAAAYILSLPADPKNAFIAGYSLVRLGLVGILIGAGVLMSVLAAFVLRYDGRDSFLARVAILRRGRAPVFFLSVLVVLAGNFLLIVTPPALGGARIERLAPILIWAVLCSAQAAVLLVIQSGNAIRQSTMAAADTFARWDTSVRAGWLLLFISLLVGLITIYFTYYNSGDEGDTYTVGWLLSTGKVLYRDLFSHHFPFSYLWTSFVTAIFGPDITAVRVSLLVLRIGVFAGALHFTRKALVIGIGSIAWSIIGPLYLGNMLLYHSFNGILIVSGAIIVLTYLSPEKPFRVAGAMFAGVMVGLAILSDPVMALPGAFIVGFLALCGLLQADSWRRRFRYAAAPLLASGSVLLAYAVYLIITSSFDEFIQFGILFNTQVYSKYTGELFPLNAFLRVLSTGINIANPAIRQQTGLYFTWDSFEFLENWLFAGFFVKLSILSGCLVLILKRRFLSAVFLYLTAAALYFRGSASFHSSPFVFLAVMVAAYLLVEFIAGLLAAQQKAPDRSLPRIAARWGIIAVSAVVTCMFLWLNIRVIEFWVVNRSELGGDTQFGSALNDMAYYRQFTCGHDDVSMLVYPLKPEVYFFSRIPPASRFLFMTPWVADVGQAEVIASLDGKAAVVAVRKDISVWTYPVKEYLADLIAYLDQAYVEIEENVYISPLLQQYCESQP